MKSKTSNKFTAWQESNQLRREELIDGYLDTLKESRVRFKHVTDLANYVARHLTTEEGKPCNKSTLLRNIRYKEKLLSHQNKVREPGSKIFNHNLSNVSDVKALIFSVQLECGNLRRERERLDIYIKSLEEQVDEFHSSPNKNRAKSSFQKPDEMKLPDFEYNYIRTCQTLRSLLSHLNTILEVDTNNYCIIDRSKRFNNIIVSEELAKPFVQWLKAIQDNNK